MDRDTLIVRTFGGFSMEWNGDLLTAGARSADTQRIRLIQLLLHNREHGVSRSQLMEVLDDDSAADDVNHLLRSVLYNIRQRFRAAGLPESQYIEFRDGRYYWTKDIPVFEDAGHFEEVCKRNELETDAVKKGELCLEACYLYRGEFLPQQTRLIWVSEEERRYSMMFRACIETAADHLRATGNYTDLEALGKHASKVSPYNEWEMLTMEALIALGKYREAQDLFEKTVDLYQKELGVRPSSEMVSKLEEFSTRLGFRSDDPAAILLDLEEKGEAEGGYYCSYYAFQGIYRAVKRSAGVYGRSAYLMVCTIDGDGGNAGFEASAAGEDAMAKTSEKLTYVICRSVRHSDIVCRYSGDQYLAIIMTEKAEDCGDIRDRIEHGLRSEGCRVRLQYDISPVA